MRRKLLEWADDVGGVFARADALQHFAEHIVDDAIRCGALVRILPSTYALSERPQDRGLLRHAALIYRPDAALAGLDALDPWRLLDRPVATGPVQMVTDEVHRESNVAQVRVVRRRGFRNEPPHIRSREGLRVTGLERTVIDSWALLPALNRRAPALVAVRDRRTTAARLSEALSGVGRTVGVAEMRHVFGLIAEGCHSELELWGHEKVFDIGELRRARCQVPLQTRVGKVYLDRYYDEEMLAVEMDGAAYHGSPGQRERDIRRDAAVAALGIQTIRFSHLRLFREPDQVRAETTAVMAMRRCQLGLRPA